jgi:hypothetical protein
MTAFIVLFSSFPFRKAKMKDIFLVIYSKRSVAVDTIVVAIAVVDVVFVVELSLSLSLSLLPLSCSVKLRIYRKVATMITKYTAQKIELYQNGNNKPNLNSS